MMLGTAIRESNELYEQEQKVIMFKDFDDIDIDSLVSLCLEREEHAKSINESLSKAGVPEPYAGIARVKFSTPFLDSHNTYIGMRMYNDTVNLRVIDKQNNNPYISKITLGIPTSAFDRDTFDYIIHILCKTNV